VSLNTKTIKIGGFDHVEPVIIGGGFPAVIQTMWKDRLSYSDLEGEAGEGTVKRIERLRQMGCGLLRFGIPDLEAAEIVGRLASLVSMPLVADIHFDYRIALRCLDFPIAKIRINPGNIGGRENVRAVLSKAALKGRPIRIGINAGSLPTDLREKVDQGKLDRAEALVQAAERELLVFREFDFPEVLVSMKASGIADTIKANRLFARKSGVPLHIGVTEAGPLIAGVVRNSAALLVLLGEGIGDTLRVSLSDTMEREVIAAREILLAASDMGNGISAKVSGSRGVVIISCPRCGRNSFDTHRFTEKWQDYLYTLDKDITVAIMGCAVNGPGEARHADLGITGAGERVLIFRRGEVIRTITEAEADAAFEQELKRFYRNLTEESL
jgi:(E)-4-hydroxy-3-methylbut-2-enyl-diphosphate synthase